MNTILTILIAIHGLLHLVGFAKAFNLFFSRPIDLIVSKTFGVIWMAIGMVFLYAALLLFLKNDYWWVVAVAAVLFSQIAIIQFWEDAKSGTFLNALILIAAIVWFCNS